MHSSSARTDCEEHSLSASAIPPPLLEPGTTRIGSNRIAIRQGERTSAALRSRGVCFLRPPQKCDMKPLGLSGAPRYRS